MRLANTSHTAIAAIFALLMINTCAAKKISTPYSEPHEAFTEQVTDIYNDPEYTNFLVGIRALKNRIDRCINDGHNIFTCRARNLDEIQELASEMDQYTIDTTGSPLMGFLAYVSKTPKTNEKKYCYTCYQCQGPLDT